MCREREREIERERERERDKHKLEKLESNNLELDEDFRPYHPPFRYGGVYFVCDPSKHRNAKRCSDGCNLWFVPSLSHVFKH